MAKSILLSELKEKLKELERASLALSPDALERAGLQAQVSHYAEHFLGRLEELPAYAATEDEGRGLYESPISEDPIEMAEALRLLEQHVDRPGVNELIGRFFGFIPGSGLYAAALGDYLAAVTNRYAGIYFASPGAVRLEKMLIRWLAAVVGYPESAAGDLTSGGSIANLIAIVTAREAHEVKAAEIPRRVVYLSEQAHHSVIKALRIAGLQECIKRYISLDERYRMQPAALEQAIAADVKAGLIPWLLVASAGTTDTGAIDPLSELAELARRHRLWFHIDGAYRAAFMLTAEGQQKLQGLERSDSLIIDPHKGLFLPFGTGLVLVKDGAAMQAAHHYSAGYMQDALVPADELSPAELSPELTRPFRGLRLWLPLKLAGVAAFRAALEEKLLLARYFYEQLSGLERFDLGPHPELSIVIFRYLPEQGDANIFNQKLVQVIQQEGRIFLSSTMLNGNYSLRFAVLNVHTHLEQVDEAIKIIREKIKALEAQHNA